MDIIWVRRIILIVYGDKAYLVLGKILLDIIAGINAVASEAGQVFLCQVGTKKIFENLQAVHRRTTTRERLACELNS